MGSSMAWFCQCNILCIFAIVPLLLLFDIQYFVHISLSSSGYLGARFEFILDEELKAAAACDDVKSALAAKISKERIGTEVC